MTETTRTLVFATHNASKLSELRRILGDGWQVLGLHDIGCTEEIPEPGETLAENARAKALHVKEHYGYDCVADDTGLEVDALGGAPGVKTARYAGEECDSAANIALLLHNLSGVTSPQERTARFVTVLHLVHGDREETFRGVAEGRILAAPQGDGGFGYDPVFAPAGESRSFAQMGADEKNAISHRGRATRLLLEALAK